MITIIAATAMATAAPDAARGRWETDGIAQIERHGASIDRVAAAFAGTAARTPILVNGTREKAHAIVPGLGARMTF